jgi:hypothetical protein
VAYPSRLLSSERSDTSAGGSSSPVTVDWTSVDEDLEIVRRSKANLLVTGPEDLVMQVIRRVVDANPALIGIPCEAGRIPLSPLPLPPVPVVFRDIDVLDATAQGLLLEWLDQIAGERPIVSTASASLLPLVNAGVFNRRLYYRVNTVYIKLDQPAQAAS